MLKGRGLLLITSFICTITVGEASFKVQETRTDGPAASLPQTTTTIGKILTYYYNVMYNTVTMLYIYLVVFVTSLYIHVYNIMWIKLHLKMWYIIDILLSSVTFFCCLGKSISNSQGASTGGPGASPSQIPFGE